MEGKTQIAFLGGGNMAEALLGGLLGAGSSTADSISVIEPDAERRTSLQARFSIMCFESAEALLESPAEPEVLVLATKPQVLKSALHPLRGRADANLLLLSIAAGTRIAAIREYIDSATQPVIRSMPNTPSLVAAGVAGLYAPSGISDHQKSVAERILSAAGAAFWVESEQQLDAVTAVSGSGPAYYFLFTEALAQAGVELGLDPELAAQLAAGTALGAAKLMQQNPANPAELRRRVTSPGGTTERAIEVFENAGLRNTIMEAVTAAAKRANELGR